MIDLAKVLGTFNEVVMFLVADKKRQAIRQESFVGLRITRGVFLWLSKSLFLNNTSDDLDARHSDLSPHS